MSIRRSGADDRAKDPKSAQAGRVKSLTSLWSCMANELAIRCCTSATHDVKTVVSRAEHEGLWFLAVTLADFGKAIEKWLDQGLVDLRSVDIRFHGNRRTGMPPFLGGFLGRVFDTRNGVLLEEPDIEAVYALRQLTLTFSKIALPRETRNGVPIQGGGQQVVTPERREQAMLSFLQCEQDVRAADANLDYSFREEFRNMSTVLFGDLFTEIERKLIFMDVLPKHGPGAVADRLTSNGKWNSRTWTARLEQVFPAREFLVPNSSWLAPERVDFDGNPEPIILEPGAELPVRVITVPKTLKTPRIIAIEPTCMQYVQQGLLQCILDAFKGDSFLSRVIGFDDQDPNRVMAAEGSLSGDLATLDLSEASDRVSFEHVRVLLSGHPLLLAAVDATRSRKARVPGHGVIRLAKFASMGSALCFPFEAMVFLTVIFCGIARESSTPLSRETLIKRFRERVRVFGDDLIVPRDSVLSVVQELETFGFRVNMGKSFWTGRFRESCGREYYDGQDVSVVKVRQLLPTRRQDADGVIAAVALRNQLYWSGLWKSAAWMDSYLRKLLKAFPNVAPSSPILGRESALGYQFERLDPSTHSPLAKGYYVCAEPPEDNLNGIGALLKCLVSLERRNGTPLDEAYQSDNSSPIDVASVNAKHLERTGRPQRVDIKLGWRSPF